MPPKTIKEKVIFNQDKETTNKGKNDRLATLLRTAWNDLSIVKIDRIEIGSVRGWKATYRE